MICGSVPGKKPKTKKRILKHLFLGWHAGITSYYSRISGGWCLLTSFLWDGFFFFRTLSWLHFTGVSTSPCKLTNIPHKKAFPKVVPEVTLSPKTHGSVVSMNSIWKVSTIQTRWTHPIFHWTMIFHHYGRKVSSLPRLVGTPNHQPSIKNPRVKRASRIWS